MRNATLNIRIDFPALSDLVTFLREQNQGKVDALTAQVSDLAARLKTSSSALKETEDASKL